MLAHLLPAQAPVRSTRAELEATKPNHESALRRADAYLRLIDDFRRMDGQIGRQRR